MKQVLYAKYNRMRCPQFQISTCIFKENENYYVEKKALNKEAQEHVDSFIIHYQQLKDNYKKLVFLKPEKVNGSIRFPYMTEMTIEQELMEHLNDIYQCLELMKNVLDLIFCFDDEYIESFQVEDGFEQVFTVNKGITGKAIRFANIDLNFDNLMRIKDKIVVLDYEWVFPFLVPVDYVKYRALKYFYIKNAMYLEAGIKYDNYIDYFGIPSEMVSAYENMEEGFQQYVFGKDRCNNYTVRYEKKVIGINPVTAANEIVMKDVHIRNIEAINVMNQQKIEELKKQVDSLEKIKQQQYEENQSLHSSLIKMQSDKDVLERLALKKDEELKSIEQRMRYLEEQISEAKKDIYDKNVHIENITALMEYYKRILHSPKLAMKVFFKHMYRKIVPIKVRKGIYVLRHEGFNVFLYKTKLHLQRKYSNQASLYEKWIAINEQDQLDTAPLDINPKISVVVPVYNVIPEQLRECINSVIDQTYNNWELCIADDCSTWESVRETLKSYEGNSKIKIVYRDENGHISKATNSAIEVATGEFIAFLDCDDILAPNALYEMAKKVNENPKYDFIYSDEDKVDENGKRRHSPNFKPDWSPDTFMSLMYTCHFSMYRTSIVRELGGLRTGFEGAQDYDFTLRFTERTQEIGHIPKILYHWRQRKESTAINPESKPYILEAAKKAKEEALCRRGLDGSVELVENVYQYRVNYINPAWPLVSIIIPSKDNYEILKQCLDSIHDVTVYPNYELIIVDNGSADENRDKIDKLVKNYNGRYYYNKEDFNFSHMCNTGASYAQGEYLLFLNDDIKVQGKDWLTRLVGHASLSHVGAVGCKLLYPDTSLIQHTGIINIKPGPSHALCRYDDNVIYEYGRNKLDYNYIAVTGACLLLSKKKFNEVNGFNEELKVAYNDVDLCFKLIEVGYYNVVRNDVVLYHYESISRGNDIVDEKKFRRLQAEREFLHSLHPKFKGYDPFYNRNLTQLDCNFSVGGFEEKAYSPCEKVEEDYMQYLSETNIIYIDSCDINGKIQGWSYVDKIGSKTARYIILNGSSETLAVKTFSIYRPDVATAHKNKKMAFCGFECKINPELLNDTEYRIGLLYVGKYKKVFIQTKRILRNDREDKSMGDKEDKME